MPSTKSGWEVFRGATGGYIVGFIVAAALTGYLAERRWTASYYQLAPR